MLRNLLSLLLAGLAILLLVSCSTPGASSGPALAPDAASSPTSMPIASALAPQVLRLATTTSTADSGLLDAILPDFEQRYNATVEVIALGTGQALETAARGDADVVLVHARAREDAFVNSGDGINRRDVMYNDFVIVGPSDDPAGIKGQLSAGEAFKAIAEHQATFDARGDDSGTATKELSIWASIGITPAAELGWYKSLGQGMGETLITANEQRAYALSDRGTYLAMRGKLPNLAILVGGESIAANADTTLLNPYGVIPVNPAKHPGVKAELAERFAAWITSAETEARIGAYGNDTFGQPLFYPGTPKL